MMNNNGLYIKEFEARGENVSTSKLTFQKGCNVEFVKCLIYEKGQLPLRFNPFYRLAECPFIENADKCFQASVRCDVSVFH